MGSAHEPGAEVTATGVLIEALSRGLAADRLVVDPDVLAAISHDDAEWAPTGSAAVGVRARSDLVGLFVGSEGTLGVVTEVTLRLRPAQAGTPRTVVGAFADLVTSGQAVAQITRRGLTPAVLELLNPGKG
jgi:FAD/FMN-containing dehydrogenase